MYQGNILWVAMINFYLGSGHTRTPHNSLAQNLHVPDAFSAQDGNHTGSTCHISDNAVSLLKTIRQGLPGSHSILYRRVKTSEIPRIYAGGGTSTGAGKL